MTDEARELPADWKLFDDDPETLEEAVQLAVGAASVCWSDMAGKGVFESERALEISKQLIQYLKTEPGSRSQFRKVSNEKADLEKQLRIANSALMHLDSHWTPPTPVPPQFAEALRVVTDEYLRAKAKHGDNCIDGPNYTETQRLAVLVEEVGEAAHELTYDAAKHGIEGGETGRLLAEVIQVAAMAVGWVAALVPGEAVSADLGPEEAPIAVQAPFAEEDASAGGWGGGRIGFRKAMQEGVRVEAVEAGTVRVPPGMVALMIPRDKLQTAVDAVLDLR